MTISPRKWLLLLIAACSVQAYAQNKLLNIKEAVIDQKTTLAPERLLQLQWVPGTAYFTFITKKSGRECLVREDATKLTRDTLLEIDEFKSLMQGAGAEDAPDRFPPITWTDASSFRFFSGNAYYNINVSTKVAKVLNKLPKAADDVEYEPVTGRAAFTLNNNVYVYEGNTWLKKSDKRSGDEEANTADKSTAITTDGSVAISNGKAVHRNEFNINKGLFWSPKGNKLAYYRMDESMVTSYPLLKMDSRPGHAQNIKYPVAGAASHTVTVHIHNFELGRTVKVETGEPADQYLTNICWSPDEEYLFIAVLNRDQNEMHLNKYDGKTGRFIKTMLIEKHAKYVEPEHPLYFPQANAKQLVRFSKADGYNHLYLYDHNAKLLRQLTKGKFDVTELLGFNTNGSKAFYIAASEDGLERFVWSVELASGKSFRITPNNGSHTAVVNAEGTYLLDVYSNIQTPRRTTLMKTDGAEVSVLQAAPNPIIDYKAVGTRLFKLTAADGVTQLNARMFFPPNFDSSAKHPVLVYLYGGPHAQLVTDSWLGGADMWLLYMAQQGYVIFTMDNRGSANRGMDFEQATFRKLGQVEREDQMKGVEFLKKQRYVDAARMGIFGWSFGGFMSTSMMSRTDAFKVGVAGGPVIDWKLYEIMYTERYMDKPADNPEGYKDAELTGYVKGLAGKKHMLIHGTDDDVVLWQHSLTYLRKCVDEGVQVDYFVYPGHKHNVLGKDRVHLMMKIAEYFKQNL